VQHNFTYDAENRLVGVNAGIGYIYDAEGRRVGKTNGTVYTVGTSGQVLDEVDGTAWTRSEVYVGSKHLATVTSAGVFFIHSDWLGTERMRTAASGLSCETISSNPFGDNVQQSGNCNVSPDFFTGKPRDTESNLDDFGARYFSSQWGRWMSADWTAAPSSVPYATLTNPQSLNLYAYVGNDPVDGQDADGHARYDKSGSGCGIYLSYCAADGFGDGGDTLWQQQEIEWDDCEAFVQAQLLNAGNGNASSDETTPASGSTAQETNAAVVTAAPVTMEQIDAVVKPLVDSAVGALETAVEKTVTLSVETVVGVVGFVFASEQKTGEVTPPPMVPELVPSHAPTQPNPSAASEHTKNKQNKNKDRHEKNRPGRPTTKDRQKPGFKPRTPPRPQDRED